MSNAAYSCRGGIVVRKYVSVVVVSAKFIVVVVGVCGECWMILVGFSKVNGSARKNNNREPNQVFGQKCGFVACCGV
jgi:hypothetical protein